MAYKCPRCGGPVDRGFSSGAIATAGLVGGLFYSAFGAFQCKKCGKIARSEFPKELRRKIAGETLLLVLGAIIIAVLAIWFIL